MPMRYHRNTPAGDGACRRATMRILVTTAKTFTTRPRPPPPRHPHPAPRWWHEQDAQGSHGHRDGGSLPATGATPKATTVVCLTHRPPDRPFSAFGIVDRPAYGGASHCAGAGGLCAPVQAARSLLNRGRMFCPVRRTCSWRAPGVSKTIVLRQKHCSASRRSTARLIRSRPPPPPPPEQQQQCRRRQQQQQR